MIGHQELQNGFPEVDITEKGIKMEEAEASAQYRQNREKSS